MPLANTDLTTNIVNTSNVITGDGLFDDLMEANTAHLDAQFQLGRITGTDYATVYLGALQSAMRQAVAFLIGRDKTNAEVDLLSQKCVTEFGQTEQSTKVAPATSSILGRQGLLSVEQAKGFKWNADQKYLKTILDAWSINTSTAGVAATQVDALNPTGVSSVNVKIANAEPTG